MDHQNKTDLRDLTCYKCGKEVFLLLTTRQVCFDCIPPDLLAAHVAKAPRVTKPTIRAPATPPVESETASATSTEKRKGFACAG